MEIYCTRPDCQRPLNQFNDLDEPSTLKTISQKYCTACGMPLILAGRYLPIKLLGQGGFGTAFLAKDRYTPTLRSCVVKQFQPAGNLNPQALEIAQNLFEREAEVLEDLGAKHRQIPDLYAFFPLFVPNRSKGKDDQFFYLVQEYINGQTLEDKIASKGLCSETEVQEIVTEMLKILQFVHENGTIHRDIKPSNIMQHKNGLYYLLDFGAVKQVTKAVGPNQNQSTGIYSVGYAPPEQMTGGQVYPATDLYALGVTAIHLLTGKPPEDLYDSYHRTWNWHSFAPNISDRFAQFLDRLLQASPKDRYASAAEALQMLENLAIRPQSHTQLQTPISQPPASGSVIKPVSGVGASPSSPAPLHPPTSAQAGSSTPAAIARPSRFSTIEQLSMVAFTGFTGALLVLGLKSVLGTPGIIVACMAMGGSVFAQVQKIIGGKDFLIFSGLILVLFLWPALRGGLDWLLVVAIAIVTAAGFVAIFVLFKLIYRLIARLL
jgi:serine/threonine-protein kinase